MGSLEVLTKPSQQSSLVRDLAGRFCLPDVDFQASLQVLELPWKSAILQQRYSNTC